ncbi:hypothetical protein BaRGS_00036127 [Batillaria attramentaria]|uniref:Uncharacterized protein n=1 Tax=Batillaria attramentaria TaxID=370345 RepID=A0ABD0JCJ9_9CAEN
MHIHVVTKLQRTALLATGHGQLSYSIVWNGESWICPPGTSVGVDTFNPPSYLTEDGNDHQLQSFSSVTKDHMIPNANTMLVQSRGLGYKIKKKIVLFFARDKVVGKVASRCLFCVLIYFTLIGKNPADSAEPCPTQNAIITAFCNLPTDSQKSVQVQVRKDPLVAKQNPLDSV